MRIGYADELLDIPKMLRNFTIILLRNMCAKLTLNVDKNIAQRAKKYARSRGRSLSDLVEDYFKYLTSKEAGSESEISPKVKSLMGSIKVPEDFEYKKELPDRIKDKHIKE